MAKLIISHKTVIVVIVVLVAVAIIGVTFKYLLPKRTGPGAPAEFEDTRGTDVSTTKAQQDDSSEFQVLENHIDGLEKTLISKFPPLRSWLDSQQMLNTLQKSEYENLIRAALQMEFEGKKLVVHEDPTGVFSIRRDYNAAGVCTVIRLITQHEPIQ